MIFESLCVLLFVGLLIYVFSPARQAIQSVDKTRVAFLHERKEVIYENLRDLNFEYRAGKYPQQDFDNLRASLENEAALVLAEIDRLERGPSAL